MRKFSVISVIFVFSLVLFIAPAMADMAENININMIVGEPIDPADAFDKSKMVRTFTYDGVEYEDLSVVYARNNEFRLEWFSDYFIPKKV